MIKIIDSRGSGKTYQLMRAVADNPNGVYVSNIPEAAQYKARQYGLDIPCISYYDLLEHKTQKHKEYYVDDVELFLRCINAHIQGYADSIDNEI